MFIEYFMLNGVLNNNGFEQKIRIKLNTSNVFARDSFQAQVNPARGYTDVYINNIKYPCKIDYDTITFLSSQYEYKIKKTDDDEILVIGKERRNILHIILCCIYKPKFFVLTNKEQV